jgi:hypothetical protein
VRAGVIALAVGETRRLLAHPAFLAGLALTAVTVGVGLGRDGQAQAFLLMGLAVLPMALGTFVATNLAAMRSRRAGTEELLDTLPAGHAVRTGAQTLAPLAAVVIAVAVLAAAYLLFGAGEGLVVGLDGTRHRPHLAELAQGPLLVAMLGVLGVALGRLVALPLLAALLLVVVVFAEVPLAAWTPDSAWRWVVPLANDIVAVPDTWQACEPGSSSMCGEVDHFDTAGMAWHLLALAGIAAAAAGIALSARRAVRAALAGGALLLLVATVAAAG